MFDVETGIYEPFASRKSIKRDYLKNSVFDIYSQLYHRKLLEEKSNFKLKAKEAIWGTVWCLQALSFLWIPNLRIKDWEENMIIWKIIGYIRLDNICSDFDIINVCLYFSISITFILSIGIFCLVLCGYFELSISKLFDIFRWVFDFWLIFFSMPSLTLYSIFLKYNIFPQKYISEYKNNNHFDDFEISVGIQFMIILVLVINFPLLYFYSQFSSEIRHSKSNKVINAKAHSKIDGQIAIFTYLLPIFYVLLNESYMIYFQLLVMIISIIIVIESLVLLPYFSLYCNTIQVLQLFTIALTSFGFILGYLMDNSMLISFFVIIIWPISIISVIQFTTKLQKNIILKTSKDEIKISKYELEKKLRHWLCLNETEHKNEIIHTFETFFTQNSARRDKLQIIWAANYCLFTLKDVSLAKIKLSKTKTISSWNLEADFQEYLCNKNINESLSNESLKFINYFQKLNLIKKKDSKLCANLLKFWEELTSPRPDLKQLANKLKWIDKNILYLNNQYKQLIGDFLQSQEGLSLYASYSRDVIYDYEKSNLLEIKLKGLNNLDTINPDLNKFSFMNDFNGILIISGEPDNFGQILFSNSKAAEIMKNNFVSLEESNIMNFIHYYYYDRLKQEIQWLTHYGSSSEIDFSKGFFLNIPGKYLIECVGKVIITSIDNNLAFILNFQLKQTMHHAALLAETGEILCYSEHFPEFLGKSDKNLIGYNVNDLFSENEKYDSNIIFYLQNKKSTLFISHTKINKLKVFYAIAINGNEEIIWKNSKHDNEEKSNINNHILSTEIYQKESNKTFDEKYTNPDTELNHTFETSEVTEKISSSKSSSVKSILPSPKKFFQMLSTSSRSINILHFAFILSIIAVLGTNIVVLLYAFSNIDFIKNIDFPMSIAQAESRLQIMAYNSQLLWELGDLANTIWYSDLLIAWKGMPGYVDDARSIYKYIVSNLPKWNYCSSDAILTDKRITVWESGSINKISLLDLLSQSAQFGYDIIRKYNNSEDYTDEVKFLKMNGYGYGFQYINNSLYEVIDCQKSLMLDFKSDMFIFLILGIGVLGLCFLLMVPFWYSVIKIENDLWNNLRKKTFRNYAEMKQTLLERLRNIHSQPEILLLNRSPSKEIFNFKNYWKYIWRVFIYFMVVLAYSLLNITYLYENCINYLEYRPEVLLEIIRTKIFINTLTVSASDVQDYIAGIPLNYILDIHSYADSLTISLNSISALRDSRLILRNPKYSSILSKKFKKMYYENDAQLYSHYLDYGSYSAEEELITEGYIIANLNVTNDAWRNWYYNMSIFRNNYDKYIDEIDNYSQNVIDNQVNIIVVAFSIFVLGLIIIYFVLYFVFFKNEKKYLEKINFMMNTMPT